MPSNHQQAGKLNAIRFDAIKVRFDRPAMVEGLLDHGAFSVIFGPPNSGKTFFLFDLALHVATEQTWHELAVEKAPVIYVAAEGARSLELRVEAWKLKRGVSSVPFWLVPYASTYVTQRIRAAASMT